MHKKIVVLGAGITGISAAYHLEKLGLKNYIVLEKEEKIGGLCRTERISSGKGDFLFDHTGHLLHLNSDYVKKMLRSFLKKEFSVHSRKAFIYLDGRYIPYPFQANMKYLEFNAMKECILGKLSSWIKYAEKRKNANFMQWINNNLGKGIAEYFMIPYNSKVFLTDPANITCDWLGKFIPDIGLKDIFGGICTDERKNYGYNTEFFYPKKGGIEKIFDFFLPSINNIKCGSAVNKIDPKQRIIYAKNGEKISYDILISTIPLDELCGLIYGLPEKIRRKAEKLQYTSVLNVNFAIKGKLPFNAHWIYFPEKKYRFYRIGFSSNISPKTVPCGFSSISAEISHKRGINCIKEANKTINDLMKMKIIGNRSSIHTTKVMNIKHGYVVFDKNRKMALNGITGYLNKRKLYSIGRYGNWEYSYMEENILTGKKTAEMIKDVI